MLFIATTGPGLAMRSGRIFLAGFLSVLLASGTVARNSRKTSPMSQRMSMEDLIIAGDLRLQAPRKKWPDAAAAIFVITQEDIRRSERLAFRRHCDWCRALKVARIDQNKWAIGSRRLQRTLRQ